MRFLTTFAFSILIAFSAWGQPVTVTPWAPSSNEPITVDVFFSEILVGTHSVIVSGQTVTIRLVQDGTSFLPNPPGVYSQQVGPLPAGDYQIVVRVEDPFNTQAQVTTIPLHVTEASPVGFVPVIEFYNAALDHYFITANALEVHDLDTGVHPGWQRTGQSFLAYSSYAAGAQPVCRFYLPPNVGDSHFLSEFPFECSGLEMASYLGDPTYLADYQLESPAAFYMAPLHGTGQWPYFDGQCDTGAIPVYRVWNNSSASNHRYTTSVQIRDQMTDAGWIAEGYGDGVAMCSPQRLP